MDRARCGGRGLWEDRFRSVLVEDGIFGANREWFSEKRKDGARTLKGLGWASPLRTMRALVNFR